MIWHWPQITYALLVAYGLCYAAAFDGQPKTGKHRFPINLCGAAVVAVLLWQGGFWAGASP